MSRKLFLKTSEEEFEYLHRQVNQSTKSSSTIVVKKVALTHLLEDHSSILTKFHDEGFLFDYPKKKWTSKVIQTPEVSKKLTRKRLPEKIIRKKITTPAAPIKKTN